jgi:hypothetical protein
MDTKSHRRTSSTENDTLVTVARSIGSALGTIASKINRAPKTVRRQRKASKSRAVKQVRRVKRAATASARKVRSKRRA